MRFERPCKFSEKFSKPTAQGQHEEKVRRQTVLRSQTLWQRQSEWKKEYLRYKPNRSFSVKQHCPFMISDCCCRLLNAFIFTLSFWISFYVWYANTELLISKDLPNAIIALNQDTYNKIEIITEWEGTESDAMLDYYNTKVTECNNDIEINNQNVTDLMQITQKYHNDQMHPTILELTTINSELRQH